MKEFIKVIGIGIFVTAIIFIIGILVQYINREDVVYDFELVKTFGYNLMYAIPLTIVSSYYFEYMNSTKIKWHRFRKYKFLISFLGSIIIIISTVFIVRIIHAVGIDGKTFEAFINSEYKNVNFYLIALLITSVISLFFHAFYFYRELQKNKIKEQKVIAGTASAKFDALKNQLDPHFLFNSLNVLTSLIEENPENAQDFTTGLSKVYRYVLEQKSKELVTVDEELSFARTYMSLLKMRFEDSIVFEIPKSASNPESKVVPLSLQLLLENAVKHNMVTNSKPLHIKIYESEGNLVVENNLQPKQIVKKSSGVGLGNIKQRYQLLTDKKVIINQGAKHFAVAIPMLTKQLSIMRRIEPKSTYDSSYMRARKRVDELKEFYYSLISYCLVIPFLIFIWYRYTPNTIQWFWFPMLGWGLGLAFHAYKVYVNDGVLGSEWEKRKIEKFMQEEEEGKRWK